MTTYNQQFTLNQGGWTNIGAGPMQIELISFGVAINVVVSDAQPTTGQLGEFLARGTTTSLDVRNASSVWAIVQPGAVQTAVVDVLSGLGGGTSSNGSAGTTSAVVVPVGTFSKWVTIQNTHATQKLSLSFNNPATTADFTLAPGAAVTLPFGLAKSLYGIGSGAATTFALIGF